MVVRVLLEVVLALGAAQREVAPARVVLDVVSPVDSRRPRLHSNLLWLEAHLLRDLAIVVLDIVLREGRLVEVRVCARFASTHPGAHVGIGRKAQAVAGSKARKVHGADALGLAFAGAKGEEELVADDVEKEEHVQLLDDVGALVLRQLREVVRSDDHASASRRRPQRGQRAPQAL